MFEQRVTNVVYIQHYKVSQKLYDIFLNIMLAILYVQWLVLRDLESHRQMD